MNKILWLLLGLLAALCAGFIAFHKADALAQALMPAFFSPQMLDPLAAHPMVRSAIAAAAAALSFTIFAGILPALGASIDAGRVISRLDSVPQANVSSDQFLEIFAGMPLFSGFVEKFSRSLILPEPNDPEGAVFAPLSARAVLDPRRESESLLAGWLMQLLPAGLFGGGAVLLLFALAADGSVAAMRPGIAASALLTGAALACYILYRAGQRFLEDRLDNLTRAIDALLPHKAELSGLQKLAAASDAGLGALRADLQSFLQGQDQRMQALVAAVQSALEKPMAELSAEQGARVQQIAEAVLKTVARDNERILAIDMRATNRAIKSLATQAEKTEKQMSSASETLTEQIGRHTASLAAQFEQAVGGLRAAELQGRDDYESRLQQLVVAFEAAVQSQGANFSALVGNVTTALSQVVRENLDSTSADLVRAAQISRDAAEKLGTVASQLPDIELKLASGRADSLKPLKNPRLTAALRELREETAGNLPPLK